jgi:Ca2+-binding EF-hand superfamily protein
MRRPSKQDAAYSASILFGKDKTLDLVFESAEEMKLIIGGIQYLIEDLKDEHDRDDLKEEERMRNEWLQSDEDGNNRLDFREIVVLMERLNIQIEQYHLRNLFNEFDEDGSGKLDFDEFSSFMQKVYHKEELEDLFLMYAEKNVDFDNKPENEFVITMPSFMKFIRDV